jgi:hypothetical protein
MKAVALDERGLSGVLARKARRVKVTVQVQLVLGLVCIAPFVGFYLIKFNNR